MCCILNSYGVRAVYNVEYKIRITENIWNKNEQTQYLTSLKSKLKFMKEAAFNLP
jgi:hypothetical protein